jgi:allantoinase
MSEARIPYSPLPTRPRLRWPNGARVAVWVVPNVEHYEYLPDPIRLRDPWPRMPHPDILGYGTRDYGNRVGFWRMTEVTDKLGIPVTLSLNLANWEHYPEIMEASIARGWDIMCHGIYNTQYHWGLAEEAEQAIIADCVKTYRRQTGKPLSGWFSPAASFTHNTPDLVAEAGISYYCDWYHDQPTWMRTRSGPLLTIPYQMDVNDAMVIRHAIEAEDFARMVIDHFDTLWAEGAEHGRVVCIALHPYIMGQPHRVRHLERALRHIAEHDDVWLATGMEIADWYARHHPAPSAEESGS